MLNRTHEEEYVSKWLDELTGLLLAAFAREKMAGDFGQDGRWMRQQMIRARELLKRQHAQDIAPLLPPAVKPEAPKQPPLNGTPTQVRKVAP